jgi:signal transduction histidine kinase
MFVHRQFKVSVEFGIASLTLSVIVTFILLIWYMVYSLNRRDKLQKLAEKERSLAYSLLQSSIESFNDILIYSVDKKYRFLNFNQAFVRTADNAYDSKISQGVSLLDCIPIKRERNKVKQNCKRALSGESHQKIEVYGEVKRTYFETRYNPILDGTKIVGVIVLSEDITKRREAEDEIKELNKELESFSYSVAHDLKTPLRSISGYANFLIEDYHDKLDEEGQRLLKMVSNGAGKMGQLIEDLLSFSKLGRQPIAKSIFNPEKLISTIIQEQLKVTEKSRVTITIGALHDILADQALMYHVFLNLISNAIKYSMKKEHAVIEIFSVKSKHEVIYTIKDNGAGFDMAYYEKLFNVFQRLHKSREFDGTGVGLAIINKIITKHGGRIWATAEVDKGADFYFSLPLNEQEILAKY